MTIDTSLGITNSSGAGIVVLSATNSVASVLANSTRQGYLQDLALLPLSGGPVLADGRSATAALDGTYVDSSGKTQPNYVYNLLVSSPASLFPVMAVGEVLDFRKGAYPPVAVTAAAAANMRKALAFCQNIQTAPSSKMAVDFQTTMTAAFDTGTIAEAESKIAAFFDGYAPFKGLDFPSYVAVSTWLQGFAYNWGMDDKGQPGQTYYVYSAPDDGKTGTTSEGTITFAAKSGAPSPADPADRQSGLTITLAAPDGTTTALTFQDGQVVDGAAGAVALNCAWAYRGTFTGTGTDTTVVPVLAGTMLNKKVMAIPIAPESGFDKFWSGLSFSKLFGYFMQAMGLWMAIDFLKQKLQGKNEKLRNDEGNENGGDPPDAQQVAEAKTAGETVGDNALAEKQAQADKVAPDDPPQVPDDDAAFRSSVDQVRADASEALDQVATDNLSGGIDSASTQLDALAEIEVTPSLEGAASDLADASQSLSDGDLSAAVDSLGDVNAALPQVLQDLGANVDAAMKSQIQDAIDAQEQAAEVAEETADNSDATEDGSEEPFDDPVVPEV